MQPGGRRRRRFPPLPGYVAAALLALGLGPALAGCDFAVLGQGRVTATIDARTFKLEGGREVRLAGVEVPAAAETAAREDRAALDQLLLNRDVTLRGPSSKPDRYGRLVALVFAGDASSSVQGQLRSGRGGVFGDIADDRQQGLHDGTAGA